MSTFDNFEPVGPDPTAGVRHLVIALMLAIPQVVIAAANWFLHYASSEEWMWAWLRTLGSAIAIPSLVVMIIHLPLTIAVGISAVVLSVRRVSPWIRIVAWVTAVAAACSSYYILTSRTFKFF